MQNIHIVSYALHLLWGGGGAECSCIVPISEALPLLGGGGGGGGRISMYCTSQLGAPIAWWGGRGAEYPHSQ